MENVLDVYQRPYDPARPVVCMDEKPTQLLGQVREPRPVAPGRPARQDYEYRRNGTANVFVAFEALANWRHLKVTARRTKIDFAHFIKDLVDERYADVKTVVLVMDNLNTHTPASLYEAFAPEEAKRIADRLEIHHTPKHGSWLNMAEIELSALGRSLPERLEDVRGLVRACAAIEKERNRRGASVDWQFRTADARIKLKRLYPSIEVR